MKWVLFFSFVSAWWPYPMTSGTAEFNRQEDCDGAAQMWVYTHPNRTGVATAYCAPKFR